MKLTPVSRSVLRALLHGPRSQVGLHVDTGRRVTYPLLDRLRNAGFVRYDPDSFCWEITAAARDHLGIVDAPVVHGKHWNGWRCAGCHRVVTTNPPEVPPRLCICAKGLGWHRRADAPEAVVYTDNFGYRFRCVPVKGGWRREEVVDA